MEIIDLKKHIQNEILLSEQKSQNQTKKEKNNVSEKTNNQTNEMTSELKNIVSLCQDMYSKRDENTSAINLSRVDEKADYDLLFSDKKVFISIMLGKEEVQFMFDFNSGKIKKGKSVILNTKPFEKVFHKILKDTLSNKNKILNIYEEKE